MRSLWWLGAAQWTRRKSGASGEGKEERGQGRTARGGGVASGAGEVQTWKGKDGLREFGEKGIEGVDEAQRKGEGAGTQGFGAREYGMG